MKEKGKNIFVNSLSGKLVRRMIFFVLPILIILLICTSMITKSFERLIGDHVSQTISPFAAEMDSIFSSTMRYVANLDMNLSFMDVAKTQNELETIRQVRILTTEISEELSIYTDIDAVFLYNGDEVWFIQNYDGSYTENSNTAYALKQVLTDRSPVRAIFQEGFQTFEVDGAAYFFVATDVEGGICGCWFEQERLLKKIKDAEMEGLTDVIFTDEDKFPAESEAVFSGAFVSTYTLSSIPFSIISFWDRSIVFSPFYHLTHIVIISVIAAYALFAFFVVSLYRSVLRPLSGMVEMIRSFHHSEIKTIPQNPKDPMEIREVFDAMNAMISDVKNLKIRVYEEQLMKQNAELELYQMQLRPHFFMNALNNMIGFAQEGDDEKVERLGICLANHFKYILYHSRYVFVEEELEYTKSYVEMQNMQDGIDCRYEVIASDEALEYEIPILCIQTFVENAMKYGKGADDTIRIRVSVAEGTGQEHMCVSVDDQGTGFAPEVLSELYKEKGTFVEHGVGIANVKKRLNILYKGRASIGFWNNDYGGAHVEIHIPLDRANEEENV